MSNRVVQGKPTGVNRMCPQCGRFLSEGIKFCPYCGKKLG